MHGLESKISELCRRIDELRKLNIGDPKAELDVLSEALEELDISLEELAQQNDALMDSEEARENEARHYRELFDLSPDGYLVTTLSGDIQEANRAAKSMLGEGIIGSAMHKLVGHPDQQAFLNMLYSLTKKDVIRDYKLHMQPLMGQLFPASASAKVLRKSDGTAKGLHWIIRDIDVSHQADAEKALSESNETWRALMDHMPGAIQGYRTDGTVTYWNRASEQLYGYSGSEAVGKNLGDLIIPPELQEQFRQGLAASEDLVQSGELMPPGEISLLRKDGSRVFVYSTHTAICLPDRSPELFCLDVDLTGYKSAEEERKQMEEELRRARDELELRVKERTAELMNAKKRVEIINKELLAEIAEHERTERELLKAKITAEEAVMAKAHFMANMSHELRTPMNAVIGMTSILLEEPLTLEQKDFLEVIRNSGDALLALINDILDFSKMERDIVELETQPFDLRACIEESLDLVAAEASENGLDLAYTFDKEVPEMIVGDPARVRQVLANLLSNSLKFTERGEIAVTIDLQDGDIHFAVMDTGIGIPQDQMDKLFKPFSQIDSSITRKYGGTGLGLAISKRLAELMGGMIWVESRAGIGSIFHFTIKARAAPSVTKPYLSGVQPQIEGRRVLIVDDSKTIRRILSDQAFSWGMVPVTAASGQEALQRTRLNDAYDVAILDMNMPDISGIELAEEIRKSKKHLPLVAFAHMGHHTPNGLFAASLTKPAKPEQLFDILTSLFAGQLDHRQSQKRAKDKKGMSTLRILLAEDNASSQKVAFEMLRKLGYRADIAANGLEALQAIERQPYDLVLMDVRMPEMDGLEATRQIRQHIQAERQPKIIAITAYALEGDKERCLAAGMDGYISKPVNINELAEALKNIALSSASQQASRHNP